MAVIVRLETGEPKVGLWCPTCHLSSGIEVPLYSISAAGVSTVAYFRKCNDCGEPIEES